MLQSAGHECSLNSLMSINIPRDLKVHTLYNLQTHTEADQVNSGGRSLKPNNKERASEISFDFHEVQRFVLPENSVCGAQNS